MLPKPRIVIVGSHLAPEKNWSPNTAEIADLLAISPHTASRHRANLMQKLDSHTQAGLVRKAIEQGLVVLKKPPH